MVWLALVVSFRGQAMEQMALTGSRIGARFVDDHARSLLQVITMPSLVALILSVLALALWRGSRRRALWAASTVVLTNLSTQVLKHWVLWRPDYGFSQRWDAANTLPSGHTAVAASAAVALVLVVSPRWRPAAAWAGALLAATTGYSTLVCQWHRPGDVLAALLLAMAWGALAVALGAWDDEEPTAGTGQASAALQDLGTERRGASRTPTVLLLVAGLLAGLVAVPLELWTFRGTAQAVSRADTFVAYAAGASATVAVACVCVALLALLAAPRR